jgi:serine/threonine protein kinase
MAGGFIGTPRFMSPEQAVGGAVDSRSDIYSFGAVVFRALTGCHLSSSSTAMAILLDVIHTEAPKVSSLRPGVPPEVDEALAWALAKSPEDRPQSVEQWVESFVDVIEAMPETEAGWLGELGLLRPLPTVQPSLAPSGATAQTRPDRADGEA